MTFVAFKCNYELGLLLALITALISGVSVFVNGSAVKLADPSAYTLLKNIGCLVFLFAGVLAFREIQHFRSLSSRQWVMLILIGIVGGSIPFLMFFTGLQMGGAAVSSFIYRSLFLFAGISGYFVLQEKPSARDVAAGVLILAGNALLLSGNLVFGTAQLLVLGATAFWALEYTISRKLLAVSDSDVNSANGRVQSISDVVPSTNVIHPRVVMVSRMLFGSLVLIGFFVATGSTATLFSINFEVLQWLLLTSLLLTGFVVCWYHSLKYVPVLQATAILALGGIVTALLDLVFHAKMLLVTDAVGLVLMLCGVILMLGMSVMLRSCLRLNEIKAELIAQ